MTIHCPISNLPNPFEVLFQNASIGIMGINRNGIIQCINIHALKIFGYSLKELEYHSVEKLIPKRYYKNEIKYLKKYFDEWIIREKGERTEMYGLTKDGREVIIELSVSSFTNNNEQYAVLFINDITDRKSNTELNSKEDKYRNIIYNINIGLLEVDLKNNITFANRKFLDMCGYTIHEILGKKPEDIFTSGSQSSLIESKHELRLQGKSDVYQLEVRNKKGEKKWWLISGAPNFDDDGNVIGSIGLHLDITDQKSKEIELVENLKKEREVNGLKSKFVSMASHEFRTPLSTILSSAFLLEKYTKTEDQHKRMMHINHIVSSVNMLTAILNDLLSVGKIEEGKIPIKYSKINIENIIENLINQISNTLKKRQKIFYNHIGTSYANLDETLLKHIMMNLISNASKFSKEGSIIEINSINKANKLIISVKDTGIGIAKEDQKHLSESFFRGRNVENIQGTGLGLHIVNEYTQLMHGKIAWKSKINEGSEFIISFNKKMNNEALELTKN